MRIIGLLICSILLSILSCNTNHDEGKNSQTKDSVGGKLIIFHAGSMSVPLKKIANQYMNENPAVEILLEAAGSRECARKISDLKKDCDIMISADYAVIDELLVPEYAAWNIKFASNEMVVAFTDKSRYNKSITADNFFDILLKNDVAYGRSDPNADPCGYRTVIACNLAETYYKKPGLSEKLQNKDNKYIRPKEVDLLSMLEVSEIDYIFIYKSVAIQHKLKYIELPDSINLKKLELNDYYKNSKVEVTGKTPGSLSVINGEAMIYGLTMIKNAPNPSVAIHFIDFFLSSEKGMKIVVQEGQNSVIPSICSNCNELPGILKPYVLNPSAK
jgi:molybdate/tungstate transport system substrate-binding protein